MNINIHRDQRTFSVISNLVGNSMPDKSESITGDNQLAIILGWQATHDVLAAESLFLFKRNDPHK